MESTRCDWVEAWRRALAELRLGDGQGDVEAEGRAPAQHRTGRPGRVTRSERIGRKNLPPPGTLAPGRTTSSSALPAAVMRAADGAEVDPEAAERVARARSGGARLDAALQRQLESALRTQLDGVRVHTGTDVDAAARTLGAVAFAIGDDVFFRDGAYDPQRRDGQRLIAHEVAHTVQARSAAPAGGAMTVSQPGDALERDADEFADEFVRGLGVRLDNADASRIAGSRHDAAPAAHTRRDAGAAVADPRGREPERVSEQIIPRVHAERVGSAHATPFLARTNATETQAVLRTGTVRGSGVQFYPRQVASTRISPVSGEGGLLHDERNRLSVIIGAGMSLRRLAGILLPLWNSAAPFAPPGAGAAPPTSALEQDVLARGLLVYNRYFLAVVSQPAPSMTGFATGLRFPLPVEIDQTGEGVVNKDLVRLWAGTFDPIWEPLLDQAASTGAAPGAAAVQQEVSDFVTAHPGVQSQGIALGARAITNAVQARPFVTEMFHRVGAGQFELALAVMDNLVQTQIGLLASQTEGTDILHVIGGALAGVPARPTAEQQQSLDRANRMLGLGPAVPTQQFPGITTPLPQTAQQDATTQAARLAVGNAQFEFLPDQQMTAAEARSGRAQTSHHLSYRTPGFQTRGDVVTSFDPVPDLAVQVQTRYPPGWNPADPSGYGRGTTAADVAAGDTSLGFHEGNHGSDYLRFAGDHPAPQFSGRVGMTVAQFRAAIATYTRDINAYSRALDAYSIQNTDCVGTTIQDYNAAHGGPPVQCGP